MFPIQDDNPARTIPFVTWLIILVNVVVFLGELSMNHPDLEYLVKHFGLVPRSFALDPGSAHEITTLLTSMFLHGGWLHVIANMWALFIFGDNVEDRLGHAGFLCFYLVCGVAAGLAQVYTTPDVAQATIGASGAIAGVLGGYLMLFPSAKVLTVIPIGFIPWFIRIPAYFYLGFWFVMQALTGYASVHFAHGVANVAFFAHVGGFVTGFLLVRICQRRDYPSWHRDEYLPY